MIALDRREEKLQFAEKLGADHVVNISQSQNIRAAKCPGSKEQGLM